MEVFMRDLIIIGGGPGGYAAALRAKDRGLDVLLIEEDRLGGTCLNRGCIPTKALVKNAEVVRTVKNLKAYGVEIEGYTVDYAQVKKRKDEVTDQLVKGIEMMFKQKDIPVVEGRGYFVDENTVEVAGEKYLAKNFLIATGSIAFNPPIPGSDLPGVIDSDELLELEELPEHLFVSGASIVGLEFASVFLELGSKVTVSGRTYLKREDKEIQKRSQNYLKRQGMKFHLGGRMQSIEETDQGLKVTVEGRKGPEEIICDKVLLSAGRQPNFSCNLEAAGIDYDRGGIKVDEELRTSVPHIFAVGDVIGGAMLAHVATYEALNVVERLAGNPEELDYRAVPSCTFVYPEIASVGKNEEDLKEEGLDYRVSKFLYRASGKALAMDEPEGFVKILADKDGLILGVHILGAGASDLISEATLAIKYKLTVKELYDTIHAHPTLPELLMEAAMAIDGLAIHQL